MFIRTLFFFPIAVFQLCIVALATPINESSLIQSELEIRAPASFVHPGVLVDLHQLNFIRLKIKAGKEPWHEAYDSLRWSPFGDLGRRPRPRANVDCGFYEKPNHGCSDEVHDALAAYATSLLWFVTGDRRYAHKSIQYMNSWARIIKSHTNKNAKVQAGWAAASWARAAEIIRHTDGGWAPKDIKRFENMLRKVYLPCIIDGAPAYYAGNWDLVMIEAAQGIAVFLDDHAVYTKAMARYHVRVPAYIYLRSDGPHPKTSPTDQIHTYKRLVRYWHGLSNFWVDGLCQETCRDLAHTGSGLSSIAHVAETSRIQGVNLFEQDVGKRLHIALELHTQLEMHGNREKWLCDGNLKPGLPPVTEVAFNAMQVGLGVHMPHTKVLTKKNRPAYTNFLDLGFETLSHAKDPL